MSTPEAVPSETAGQIAYLAWRAYLNRGDVPENARELWAAMAPISRAAWEAAAAAVLERTK